MELAESLGEKTQSRMHWEGPRALCSEPIDSGAKSNLSQASEHPPRLPSRFWAQTAKGFPLTNQAAAVGVCENFQLKTRELTLVPVSQASVNLRKDQEGRHCGVGDKEPAELWSWTVALIGWHRLVFARQCDILGLRLQNLAPSKESWGWLKCESQ